MKDATLCYIFDDNRILLQKKAEGRFGGGKWNAPGGKIKTFETPIRAVIREVREETGLKVSNVSQVGILTFLEEDGKDKIGKFFTVHVFKAGAYSGEMRNSPEGKLKWFDTDSIPYDGMWEDDTVWFPAVLNDKGFRGDFLFTKGFKKMIDHKMVTQ